MPSTGIKLRDDFDAPTLRQLSRRCDDTRLVRRLLALAAIYDDMSRADAARAGGMDRQTLRDWILRFNAEGPDGLTNRQGAGRPRLLNDDQMRELSEIVKAGPDPAVDGVVRYWRFQRSRPLLPPRKNGKIERQQFLLINGTQFGGRSLGEIQRNGDKCDFYFLVCFGFRISRLRQPTLSIRTGLRD